MSNKRFHITINQERFSKSAGYGPFPAASRLIHILLKDNQSIQDVAVLSHYGIAFKEEDLHDELNTNAKLSFHLDLDHDQLKRAISAMNGDTLPLADRLTKKLTEAEHSAFGAFQLQAYGITLSQSDTESNNHQRLTA